MKKSTHIINLATAALLAATPIVTAVSVSAADMTATQTPNNESSGNPVITYNGKSYDSDQNITDLIANTSLGRVTPSTSAKFVQDVKAAFSAIASSSDRSKVDVTVYTGDINYNIAGKYPVKVSAANQNNKVTTLTFNVVMGNQGANATYAVVRPQIKGNVGLFTIRDGKVLHNSYGSFVLANGTTVATFGTETINGVSYTRLNSADSDLFVETKSVDGTYPLASATTDNDQTKTVTKMLMHTAIAYNADGHSKGKKYYAYRHLVLNATKANIKGSMYYQVQGTSDYIKAGNIDGTERTLTHNAYIYATSTRRSSYTLLRKGTTITTYGGSYRFKNDKRYYRIEGATASNKRYVKVINFE